MSAPPSFRAVSVDEQDCPNPCPPRFVKSQIYCDPRVFKVIDDHAIDVSTLFIKRQPFLVSQLLYVYFLAIYIKININDYYYYFEIMLFSYCFIGIM